MEAWPRNSERAFASMPKAIMTEADGAELPARRTRGKTSKHGHGPPRAPEGSRHRGLCPAGSASTLSSAHLPASRTRRTAASSRCGIPALAALTEHAHCGAFASSPRRDPARRALASLAPGQRGPGLACPAASGAPAVRHGAPASASQGGFTRTCADTPREGCRAPAIPHGAWQSRMPRGEASQCPRLESNQGSRFRKPLLYPLSYGGRTWRLAGYSAFSPVAEALV